MMKFKLRGKEMKINEIEDELEMMKTIIDLIIEIGLDELFDNIDDIILEIEENMDYQLFLNDDQKLYIAQSIF